MELPSHNPEQTHRLKKSNVRYHPCIRETLGPPTYQSYQTQRENLIMPLNEHAKSDLTSTSPSKASLFWVFNRNWYSFREIASYAFYIKMKSREIHVDKQIHPFFIEKSLRNQLPPLSLSLPLSIKKNPLKSSHFLPFSTQCKARASSPITCLFILLLLLLFHLLSSIFSPEPQLPQACQICTYVSYTFLYKYIGTSQTMRQKKPKKITNSLRIVSKRL